MQTIRLSENGQLTLPEELRKALNLKSGDLLQVEIEDDSIVLKPQRESDKEEAKNRFFATIDKIRERNKDIPREEIEALVDEAVKAVREEDCS